MPRRENDFYPTPAWATKLLIARANIPRGCTVLEPCAGDGAIANVIKKYHNGLVITNDIDRQWSCDAYLDACDDRLYDTVEPDVIISNPPFSLAHVIVPKAVASAYRYTAMLLRLSWLEPVLNRGMWLAKNPPDQLIVLPRISFTGDGKTDSVPCAWFIWETTPFSVIHPIEVIPRLNRQVVDVKQ